MTTLSGEAPSGGAGWRLYVKPVALLLVAAVSLYLLLPTLMSVFGAWRSLSGIDWNFGIFVFGCEGVSYLCLWQVDRIALRTKAWFPIVCAQLAGNAVGRIVPGAPTPFTVGMLRKAGVDAGQAAAAFTTSTGLQLATTAALPIFALPAILGGAPSQPWPRDRRLPRCRRLHASRRGWGSLPYRRTARWNSRAGASSGSPTLRSVAAAR